MYVADIDSKVAASSTIDAVRKNPQQRNFVQTHQDFEHMTFEDFEAKTLHSYFENVCHLPDEGNHMLAAVDITNVGQGCCDCCLLVLVSLLQGTDYLSRVQGMTCIVNSHA